MARLEDKFKSEITKELMTKFEYKSVMQVPKIEKIVINMGVGDAVQNSKALDNAVAELALISGQKPLITRAKNQSLHTDYVKVCLSVQKLLYVGKECMNSSIN